MAGERAQKGQPIKLSANDWNDMLDASDAHKRNGRSGRSQSIQPFVTSTYISVLNTSDSTWDQYRVVGLTDEVVIPPDEDGNNLDEFLQKIVFKAVTPDEDTPGRWAITQEAISPGEIGRVCVVGWSYCWINLGNTKHTYIESTEDTTTPKSGYSGTGKIVWVDGGAGTAVVASEQWAIIQIGGDFDSSIWAKITGATPIPAASNRWSYAWVEQTQDQTGRYVDKPGGLTSTATAVTGYNTIEAFNSDEGIQGNGVDLDNMPEGTTLLPAQGNPVVRAYFVIDCNGDPALHFSYENGIDVPCEVDSGL